jgi:hypothetical protein
LKNPIKRKTKRTGTLCPCYLSNPAQTTLLYLIGFLGIYAVWVAVTPTLGGEAFFGGLGNVTQ